jgi:hypothetical protein
VLSFRIAILCLLFCVPARDTLPAVSSGVFEAIYEYFLGLDVEEVDRFSDDDANGDSRLPANIEEDDSDFDDYEEGIGDCRHGRVGDVDVSQLAQFVDLIHAVLAFRDSFVKFQPLRV